jgi:hypothetical protein
LIFDLRLKTLLGPRNSSDQNLKLKTTSKFPELELNYREALALLAQLLFPLMKPSLLALIFLLTFPAADAQTITSKPSRYGPVIDGYFKGADGVRLFYRQVGKGKNAVVFLHGGPGLGIGDGGYDMEPLARDRVLLLFDKRGSGRSEIVTGPRLLTLLFLSHSGVGIFARCSRESKFRHLWLKERRPTSH